MPCECCENDQRLTAEDEWAEIHYRFDALTRYRDDLAVELRQIDRERAMLLARMAVEARR